MSGQHCLLCGKRTSADYCNDCMSVSLLEEAFRERREKATVLQAKLDRAVEALEEIEYTTYEVGIQKIARAALDALEQLEVRDE